MAYASLSHARSFANDDKIRVPDIGDFKDVPVIESRAPGRS
jgi:hypothetical protein